MPPPTTITAPTISLFSRWFIQGSRKENRHAVRAAIGKVRKHARGHSPESVLHFRSLSDKEKGALGTPALHRYSDKEKGALGTPALHRYPDTSLITENRNENQPLTRFPSFGYCGLCHREQPDSRDDQT
jgi:hypothetical protein